MFKNGLAIYTTDGTFEMNISMEDLITQLNGSFVQTHTSFIVNMKYIVGVVNQNVLLLTKDKAEVKIPLSRKYIKQATVKIFARLGGAI
ncbi:MAG: LytTR family transcriptional regulator [Streptococcaceae bacterium]|nr:LytTR family transcriptional regulator [Streptococcaceae bacterium]